MVAIRISVNHRFVFSLSKVATVISSPPKGLESLSLYDIRPFPIVAWEKYRKGS
jgi:hypothetical protein